ncbi:hypothetical protein MK338_10130, partial [Streptococcus vestibularis]|nr:hypothetical protein [Streptococcus vestibularis]
IIAIVG